MTRYLVISSFLNFLAAGLLAFAVVVRGRKDRLNVLFGVFAFNIGSWSAGYLFWQTSENAVRALLFSRLLMFFAYFLPVSFFHFVAELCGVQRRWWVRTGYVAACGLVVLNFTPLMVSGIGPVRGFPFWPVAGPFYWLYLVHFGVFFFHSCLLLARSLRSATGSRATQLRYILVSSIVGFSGGATNFPLWYGVPLPPFGNLLIFIYLVIMAHAVSRYHLPLVTYDFVYAGVYIGLSVTLAVFYLLGLNLVAPLVGVELTASSQLTQFLLCLVVCLFFFWAIPRLTRVTDRIMAQTYLRRRNTQQLQLKELGQRIFSLGSEQEIFENSAREIARAFNLRFAAIYARSEFDHDFQLRAQHGWASPISALPIESVVTRVFAERMTPLLLDGSEIEFGATVVAELDELRRRLPIEAVFPVASDEFISGVLLLGGREDGERYTEAEIALLESTALQIAVTLRARQLERHASQTEKLIALGTLAAGLAHELRNPLVSIQTFSALLKERGADPDFQQEFSNVVQRDVNRVANIVANVAAFAESNKVEMTAVNVPEVLRTVTDLVHSELQRSGIVLTLPVLQQFIVRGNYSQLLQVFLNLVQNAIQALEGRTDGVIKVSLELRAADAQQPLVCVSVSDNGPGIDPGFLPHVFEPFTTTKATGQRRGKHGMGLGLAIVKRIVQHHHGDIRVSSSRGEGTNFRVHLPLYS